MWVERAATNLATPSQVKAAFSHRGIPLASIGRSRVAGYDVARFDYDTAKLTTTTQAGDLVLHGQWLVVLVFKTASDASHALDDPQQKSAMRAYGLTVIARGNVVATILRGDATPQRLKRVRSAIQVAAAP